MNEALLIKPEQAKPKEEFIIDANTLVQLYIKPEKDLLDFTNEDIAAIEEDYIKAYAHLDKL